MQLVKIVACASWQDTCWYHRYLMDTRWCISLSGQAKIEAGSQSLVVPTELTRSMIICVFCKAKMEKLGNKSSFMQLKCV